MTGFDSKRQMAQDKVAQPAQEPDELTIAYMSGLYDGKKAEREACAKLVEAIEKHCIELDCDDPALFNVAAAIRARGNT